MKTERKQNRAWIEIDLQALEHNVKEIQRVLPTQTKIMGVVKANAYGHGAVEVSQKLNEMGITDFAVATLDEGIELREAGIRGEILILGYTDLSCVPEVIKYDLTQTILDEKYARNIQDMLTEKIKAQVKINTGMNRNGIDYRDYDGLAKVYQMTNLEITGTFSHLCVSDGSNQEDKDFTKKQIERYFATINQIRKMGYNPGNTHIQASYGILNYPGLPCDFARPGVILYGIYSQENDVLETNIDLKPVLSLKARVMSVHTIEKGDSVGYGRTFIAKEKMQMATVAIGYADGYPRNLSGQDIKVLVNGEYATIIGRICMDQLMITLPMGKELKAGDIVTLIGKEQEIRAEKVSEKAATITNELLSSLGRRLPIVAK